MFLLMYCHICAANKVTLGVQNIAYYPHYDYTDERQDSLLEWLLLQIEQDTELEFEVRSLPIKRLDHAFFEAREIDLIFPVNPRWYPGIEHLEYSAPIVNIIGGTMVKPEKANMVLDEFKVLVVPFGFKPIEWFKIKDKNSFRIFEVADAKKSLNMVLSGRADGADIEYNVAQYLLARMGKTKKLKLAHHLPLSKVSFHIAGIKDSPSIEAISQWIMENTAHIKAYKKALNLIEHDKVPLSNTQKLN
ncbi:MAG: hypothetical protein ACFHVJ_02065 [Aestuariibacter sp.]